MRGALHLAIITPHGELHSSLLAHFRFIQWFIWGGKHRNHNVSQSWPSGMLQLETVCMFLKRSQGTVKGDSINAMQVKILKVILKEMCQHFERIWKNLIRFWKKCGIHQKCQLPVTCNEKDLQQWDTNPEFRLPPQDSCSVCLCLCVSLGVSLCLSVSVSVSLSC